MALTNIIGNTPVKPIDGYTPQQRFFLAYGQIWCQNVTDQQARSAGHHRSAFPGTLAGKRRGAEFGCVPGGVWLQGRPADGARERLPGLVGSKFCSYSKRGHTCEHLSFDQVLLPAACRNPAAPGAKRGQFLLTAAIKNVAQLRPERDGQVRRSLQRFLPVRLRQLDQEQSHSRRPAGLGPLQRAARAQSVDPAQHSGQDLGRQSRPQRPTTRRSATITTPAWTRPASTPRARRR